MPPQPKRGRSKLRGAVSESAMETAGGVVDEMREPPPRGKGLVYSDDEVDDATGTKRYKSASTSHIAETADSADVVAPPLKDGKKEKKDKKDRTKALKSAGDSEGVLRKMQEVTDRLREGLFALHVPNESILDLMKVADEYGMILGRVLLENERLRGELVGIKSVPRIPTVAPVVGQAVTAGVSSGAVGAAASARAKEFPALEPAETWSLVVRGRGGATPEEVKSKVLRDVTPTLGVRIHSVNTVRDGGTLIRTPSLTEREKIVASGKLEEAGLDVSVQDRLGPRIVVRSVSRYITPGDFMRELYVKNFEVAGMTSAKFDRSLRMVTAPWKKEEGEIDVTLECTEQVAERLRATGVYILWFRYVVRINDVVRACHRCYGYDHVVRQCNYKESVCRICGQMGHVASRCVGPVHCRNCAWKGKAANHRMMTMDCPMHAAMVARVNARH